MKKAIILWVFLCTATLASAQQILPIPTTTISPKPTAHSGQPRGLYQFEVSYHNMELNYSDFNRVDFGYFGWDLNKNFYTSCNPPDTTDFNSISWAAVVFDSIHDYVNDVPYQKTALTA